MLRPDMGWELAFTLLDKLDDDCDCQIVRWELAFTLLDKLEDREGNNPHALGISIHPS